MEKNQTGCPPRWCIIANALQRLREQVVYPPKSISITSYADDITLTTSHPQVEKLRDIITPCLNILSAEKSSATVFATWSNEAKFDPHLTINNSAIPVMSKVKVLGVTFDSMLNFGEDVKAPKRNYKSAKDCSQ